MNQDDIKQEVRMQVFELKHNAYSYDRQMVLYIDEGSLKELTRHIPLLADGTIKSNEVLGLKYYLVESIRPHINVTYKD